MSPGATNSVVVSVYVDPVYPSVIIFNKFYLRVRDELKMTIAAYQTLYQSSVTFGMRKQLQSEAGKSDLENKIVDLE